MSPQQKSIRKDKGGDGSHSDLDAKLDEALKDTFPASDPVAVGRPSKEPRKRVDRKPAPIDMENVKRLAKQLEKRQARKA